MSKPRISVTVRMTEETKGLADAIAAAMTRDTGTVVTRGDVFTKAIRELGRKVKIV